ncbi:MAG: ABC transporter permease [Azoarcus sp.]|jgi:putative ABC transport system permease protein|nr:ABC transporter permease [Azoarcus sp.]
MRGHDLIRFSMHALAAHRLRSFLTLLGIAVGIATVILLTTFGESLHSYVLDKFSQFGTNIISITPGQQAARGGIPGLPTTARELTLEDAEALARIPWLDIISPESWGNTELSANGRVRRAVVHGVGPRTHDMYTFEVAYGQFLPKGNSRDARALVVIGKQIKEDLFGAANALGERITIGGERYIVIGVLGHKGEILGIDINNVAYIPAMRAMTLFNRPGLQRINVTYNIGTDPESVKPLIHQLLVARHGREDFSINTQAEMIARLLNILSIITATIGALGGISLLVGSIGIVTIMTIAVTERTREIGLLIALGARRGTILALFLAEAVVLAALGGLLGLSAGIGLAWVVGFFAPEFPVTIPWPFALAAEIFSAIIGLAAGGLPARHAAQMNVIDALRAE